MVVLLVCWPAFQLLKGTPESPSRTLSVVSVSSGPPAAASTRTPGAQASGAASEPEPAAQADPCSSQPDLVRLAQIQEKVDGRRVVRAAPEAWERASPQFNSSRNLYIFVMSPAYWGSTSLLALLASSPQTATLCRAGGGACEGQELLYERGLMGTTEFNKMEPDVPWDAAMDVYKEWWEKMPEGGKPVRLEKSTASLANVDLIADYFERHQESEAYFMFVTRSPCGCGAPCRGGVYEAPAWSVTEAMGKLWKFPRLLVHYEDLLRDPYEVAERVLEWAPALRSLDPAASVLPRLNARLGTRTLSPGDFALDARSGRARSFKRPDFPPNAYELSDGFGYTCCKAPPVEV